MSRAVVRGLLALAALSISACGGSDASSKRDTGMPVGGMASEAGASGAASGTAGSAGLFGVGGAAGTGLNRWHWWRRRLFVARRRVRRRQRSY